MPIARDSKKLVSHPKQKSININASELQIYFSQYKTAVEDRLSLVCLLSIFGLWSSVLTGNFNPMFGHSAEEMKFGFSVLALILSLLSAKPFLIFVKRMSAKIIRIFKTKKGSRVSFIFDWADSVIESTEADPAAVIKNLVSHCE